LIAIKNAVIAILLEKRTEDAPDVQEILTKFGCSIKVRLGVHELEGCSNNGLILLVVSGEEKEVDSLFNELKERSRVKASIMYLD
jgi:hypothetical protein